MEKDSEQKQAETENMTEIRQSEHQNEMQIVEINVVEEEKKKQEKRIRRELRKQKREERRRKREAESQEGDKEMKKDMNEKKRGMIEMRLAEQAEAEFEEEKYLKTEKIQQRKEEKRRIKDLERAFTEQKKLKTNADEECRNKIRGEVNFMEYEPIFENEEDDMVTSSPIITSIDMRIKEREEIEEDFRSKMEGRITLDIGGRHFATSRKTLFKDTNSIFSILLRDDRSHYFIDRDGAHFRYILNYLRQDCTLDMAILLRENRYLLELKNECVFYQLLGLQQLVEARLNLYRDLGLLNCDVCAKIEMS